MLTSLLLALAARPEPPRVLCVYVPPPVYGVSPMPLPALALTISGASGGFVAAVRVAYRP